jgi:hypothetical protein
VDSKIETRVFVDVTEPNKVKIEFQYPNGGDRVRASDGKTTWDYRALTHEYTAKPATAYDINMINGTKRETRPLGITFRRRQKCGLLRSGSPVSATQRNHW